MTSAPNNDATRGHRRLVDVHGGVLNVLTDANVAKENVTDRNAAGTRQKWDYGNQTNRRAVKQSERDVSYSQRSKARLERSRALLELSNAHAPKNHTRRVTTKNIENVGNKRPGAVVDYECAVRVDLNKRRQGEANQPGPGVQNRLNAGAGGRAGNEYRDTKDRSSKTSPSRQTGTNRRRYGEGNETDRSGLPPASPQNRRRDQYGGRDVVGPSNEDFVPFVRSSNVLNPSHADSPLPLSREPTVMERARIGYQSGHNPGLYGRPIAGEVDLMIHRKVSATQSI